MPGVLARRGPERVLEGRVVGNPARESRFLTFISPPVGAYTQALQDWSCSDPEGAMRQATVWALLISPKRSQRTTHPYIEPAIGGNGAGQFADHQRHR